MDGRRSGSPDKVLKPASLLREVSYRPANLAGIAASKKRLISTVDDAMGPSIKRLKSKVHCQSLSETSLPNKYYKPISPIAIRSGTSILRQYDTQQDKQAPVAYIVHGDPADGLSQRLYELAPTARHINKDWPTNQIGNTGSSGEESYDQGFDMTGYTTLSTIPWNPMEQRGSQFAQ